MAGEDLFETLQADRDDGHAEARRDHADARTERTDLSMFGPAPFREYQNRVPLPDELTHITKSLPRAGAGLRQRKCIEEERREVVVQAVGEPRLAAVLFREVVRVEELPHR